jgi:hypothetical protein
VLGLEHETISTLTVFLEPSVFQAFGFPLTLPDAAGAKELKK